MRVERRRPGSAREGRWIEVIVAMLVSLYVLQATIGFGWGPLAGWQAMPAWRLASGIALGALIAWMWVQSAVRSSTSPRSALWLILHRFGGIVGVVALFLHSSRWGYGYLAGLGGLFLGTVVLGVLSPAALRLRSQPYRILWLVLHVVFAVALVSGVAFHIWVNLNYI